MPKTILVLLLAFGLCAPHLSADQPQTAQPQQQAAHPYKWHGVIMIGVGSLISLAAAGGVAGIEGPRFQTCRAEAASRGVRNDCLDERSANPSLAGVGVALIAGGALIGFQRPARTPHIEVGRGRLSVVGRISF